MLAIKTPLKNLNKMRKILIEKKLIARNYKISSQDSYGYIPIKKEMTKETLKESLKEIRKELGNDNINYNDNNDNSSIDGYLEIGIIEKDFEKIKKQASSISQELKGKLSKEEIENLKTSFDIIGDIVILEIPENLQNQKVTIGEATLNFTKRKAIYMKKSAIKGVTRTRQLEHIAGEELEETIHKEHGIRLKLNVKEVYFSPRLATERDRVAKQVQDSETILDMFAGIGPFPILIAKNKKVNICAVDINKAAIEYMKENIKLNKLKGNITPILGDINKIAKEKFTKNNITNTLKINNNNINKNIKFDRIIMNLPGTGKDFLELAISLIKNNGIIHYYEFSDSYDSGIKRIKKIAKKHKKNVEVLNSRKVKSSSPGQWHIVIDAKIIEK